MSQNGNGPEETSVSTHIVESCMGISVGTAGFNREVEQCYERINERARKDRSVIVSVTQNIQTCNDSGLVYVAVIVTAQRISLADLERQQRSQQLRMR